MWRCALTNNKLDLIVHQRPATFFCHPQLRVISKRPVPSSINPTPGRAVVSSTRKHHRAPPVEHSSYLFGLIRPACGYKQRNAMHEGQIKRSIDLVNHTSRQVTAYTGVMGLEGGGGRPGTFRIRFRRGVFWRHLLWIYVPVVLFPVDAVRRCTSVCLSVAHTAIGHGTNAREEKRRDRVEWERIKDNNREREREQKIKSETRNK